MDVEKWDFSQASWHSVKCLSTFKGYLYMKSSLTLQKWEVISLQNILAMIISMENELIKVYFVCMVNK